MFILSIDAEPEDGGEVASLLRDVANHVEQGILEGTWVDGNSVRFLFVEEGA